MKSISMWSVSRGNSVSVVSGYGLDDPGDRGSIAEVENE
jgi:hypothetical protein